MLHLSFPTSAIIIMKWNYIGDQEYKEFKEHSLKENRISLILLCIHLWVVLYKLFKQKLLWWPFFFLHFVFIFIFCRLFLAWRNTKYIMEHRQCLYVVKKREKNKKATKKKHRKNYLLYTPKLEQQQKKQKKDTHFFCCWYNNNFFYIVRQ